MRVLTELIGGVTLLLAFAYGVHGIIQFFSSLKQDSRHDDVSDATHADPAADRADKSD